MNKCKHDWKLVAAAGVAAALIAGCHNGSSSSAPAMSTPPPSSTVDFTTFATQAFSNNANSTPVAINNVTFTFDSNDDPTAFDVLIASGSF